jgi:hypothetical protein
MSILGQRRVNLGQNNNFSYKGKKFTQWRLKIMVAK